LQFGRVAIQLIKTNILLLAAQNLHRSMLPFVTPITEGKGMFYSV
jgi:hypothetical protein